MGRYDLVFIDADETLFDFARAERAALNAALGAIGVEVDGLVFETYVRINSRAWREVELGTLDRDSLKTRRFEELFKALGIEGDAAATGENYLDSLSTQGWLIEGAQEICAFLRGRAKLVLLTNGIARVQRGRLERSPICAAFDHVVISEEVGFAKPDPRVFALAADLAGVEDRSRMVVVGDSLTSDIAGGVAFGIDTCWYNPEGLDPGEWRPTWTVASLGGLREPFLP